MAHLRELAAALAAAELAARIVADQYARFVAIPDAPADISTEVDRQAQETILVYLRQQFPNDALCAEEATTTLASAARAGTRLWIVDPIDGTRGFARKNGEFSIMIAFVQDGRVAVGAVQEPARGRLTYALRGGGCWRRDGSEASPSPCTASAAGSLSAAALTQSRPRDPGMVTRPVQLLGPKRIVETYSAGIKLALVARGEADLYVNTYSAFHDWDICAGQLLVEEAGGRVTGLAGQEIQYGLPGAVQRHGLLASNGRIHDAALAALSSLQFTA